MFGRAPFPTQNFPPPMMSMPPMMSSPPRSQPAPPRLQQPVPRATVQGQGQRKGVVRGAEPEEVPLPPLPEPSEPRRPAPEPPPPPAPVRIPSPEDLGIAAADRGDWSAGYKRLCDLGAVSVQFNRLQPGRCRVTCMLPGEQADRYHRIDAEGASEAEAMRSAVTEAERWMARRK